MADNEKKETAYSILKGERDTALQENVKLTAKVQELWQKAANMDIQVLDVQKEKTALKAKLEALNAQSRDNLVKKNFVDENLQKLQTENENLLRQNGALISENKQIEKLNEIKSELESDISRLKDSIKDLKLIEKNRDEILFELNSLKKDHDNMFQDFKESRGLVLQLTKELNEFKNEKQEMQIKIDNLSWENADLKKQVGTKNSRMYAFKTVVIFLAVLANYFLLGKKFMNLTGENDWQTYLISYGSVLIFDLTVILLTLLNKSKEALYFAVGVFILTFLQIAKPFQGLGLGIDFYGFNLQYFERFVSGGIYSVFFAFLPYFLSKITKE